MSFRINFDQLKPFKQNAIGPLMGIAGLYFISLKSKNISYPFFPSRLIYIGMSEKKTNSIGARLSDHLSGQSGNIGLFNYSKKCELFFTYLNFESITSHWNRSIEDLESFFILDFTKQYGVYPICNNKSGFPDLSELPINYFDIDWKAYEERK